MKIVSTKKLSPMDRLVYWIRERESIRLKKEAGEPKPWTDDEILQRYRFCNVKRMDDKVSQWLLKNWYEPFFDHPNMLVACALARFFNLPSTLESIGFPTEYNATRIKQKLRALKKQGTIFNAAYMVRGNDGRDKVSCVIDYSITPLFKNPIAINTQSMEKTWEQLVEQPGFGSFMAGQVVADLRWGLSGSWRDKKRWAPVGPGSARGMNRLLGLDPDTLMQQSKFMLLLRNLVQRDLRPSLPRSITRRLEMQDWQNCLCEYDKYCRCIGGGRCKQTYPGT